LSGSPCAAGACVLIHGGRTVLRGRTGQRPEPQAVLRSRFGAGATWVTPSLVLGFRDPFRPGCAHDVAVEPGSNWLLGVWLVHFDLSG